MRVTGPNGKIGYRWGRHGKIYYGKDAPQQAAAQGRAAHAAGYMEKNNRKIK